MPPGGRLSAASNYAARWDDVQELWDVTVFPAQRPDGREQVGHLRRCLNQMLAQEREAAAKAGVLTKGLNDPNDPEAIAAAAESASVLQLLESSPDLDRTYRVLHSIYATAMSELGRQVFSHCADRGNLLMNVWTSCEALRERMLELRSERHEAVIAEKSVLMAELGELNDRLRALEGQEEAHQAKAQELVRVTQSREKLVAMMKTLQAALASVEEQLRTSQAGRKAAESKLRTWLPHYDTYSSTAALEALEAHTNASAGAAGDTPSELVARAAQWRSSVRAQAAQLADWETPPSLPESVPLGSDALKMLMNDAGRILGAVACMTDLSPTEPLHQQAPAAAAPASSSRRGSSSATGAADAEEVSRYQQTIQSLQQQLAESRAAQQELQQKLAATSAAGGEAPVAPTRKSRQGGRVSVVLPHKGSASLELPIEPL